jgi:isopentenyl-diphosphate delta-isomerase
MGANMSDSTNRRKMQHVDIAARDEEIDRRKNYFDRLALLHRALPEINLDEVDTSTEFLGKRLSAPILISSMTGGDYPELRAINRNLAMAAEATGIAMAVGSQRVLFSHPESRASFALREFAPSTLLLANLGAVQLNYGFGIEQCREAISVLQADALYFHLNPLQEAVQPEGNVNFAHLIARIGDINARLDRPVILKEVGAGLSVQDVRLALQHGLRHFDVAGSGGTSWSRIEHFRHSKETPYSAGLLFQDWGIPTPLALLQLRPLQPEATLLASGGIRNGIDIVKSIILGARLAGLASPFLQPAMISSEQVIEAINRLKHEIKIAMFLLGIKNIDQLPGNDSLFLYPPETFNQTRL